MNVFIFPGQGTQRRGMGGGLFDQFPDLTETASRILGYSIKTLCLEDPENLLDQTRYTQPAIFVVNALAYFQRLAEGGRQPDCFAGHSLGELNALLAAGCFDFENGLRVVNKRAELMSRASGGGMGAIINLPRQRLEALLSRPEAEAIDLAIHNTATQSVVAGPKDALARFEAEVEQAGGMLYPLNTSGAFHSRYMQPIAGAFREYLGSIPLTLPTKPVIANVTARPYREGEIISNLVQQLTRPVRWCEGIEYLLAKGAVSFEEVGHSEVVTKLVAKIRADWGTASVATPPAAAEEPPEPPVARHPEEIVQQANECIAAWNARYPIGTKVRSTRVEGEQLTRSCAVLLFGHRPGIYLQGYDGYFALDELQAL